MGGRWVGGDVSIFLRQPVHEVNGILTGARVVRVLYVCIWWRVGMSWDLVMGKALHSFSLLHI